MKRILHYCLLAGLLVAPWGYFLAQFRHSAVDISCVSLVEIRLQETPDLNLHAIGSYAYDFLPDERGLLKYTGRLVSTFNAKQQTYQVNRNAEFGYHFFGHTVKMTASSSTHLEPDDAPEPWIRQYVHPLFELHATYYAKIFRLTPELLASGPEGAPRQLCRIHKAG